MEKLIKVLFLEDSKGIIKTKDKMGNLFLLSDDEIKEGDWYWTPSKRNIEQCVKKLLIIKGGENDIEQKKIIATTDRTLIDENAKYRVSGVFDEGLPQPSQSFIEKYISEYNKGNVITDILVEYEKTNIRPDFSHGFDDGESYAYDLQLKVNPKDNTITIRPVKNSWSREEIIELLYKHTGFLLSGGKTTLDQWIEENL